MSMPVFSNDPFYSILPIDSETHKHSEYKSIVLILKIATIIASEAFVQNCLSERSSKKFLSLKMFPFFPTANLGVSHISILIPTLNIVWTWRSWLTHPSILALNLLFQWKLTKYCFALIVAYVQEKSFSSTVWPFTYF